MFQYHLLAEDIDSSVFDCQFKSSYSAFALFKQVKHSVLYAMFGTNCKDGIVSLDYEKFPHLQHVLDDTSISLCIKFKPSVDVDFLS